MKNNSKGMSSLQKDINRLKKRCKDLNDSNILKKHQIRQFDTFIKILLKNERITKDEISQFMEKKNDIEDKTTLLQDFKKWSEKILESKESAQKFLQDVGINNKDGKLTKRYGGEGE